MIPLFYRGRHRPALALTEDQWDLIVDALQHGADECEDPDWAQDCSNLAVMLRNKLDRDPPPRRDHDSDVQPDPYIDRMAAAHATEYDPAGEREAMS